MSEFFPMQCKQEGHMSRDCPNAGSGGGGDNRGCFTVRIFNIGMP